MNVGHGGVACTACTDFFGLFVFTLSGVSRVSLSGASVPECVWDRARKLLSDIVHAAPVPPGRRGLREA